MKKEKEKESITLSWQTSFKERSSYLVYFTGQNMHYNLISGFLVTYLMMSGINMIKAGVVTMIVKIWDAVNDALFGAIFDSVKFKNGKKCMPWVQISTALIPIASILLFCIPNFSAENEKLIWFTVSYIFWDTAYTICDVPIYTMITTMTSNLDERNSLMSRRNIASGIGSGLTTILFTILPSENIGISYSTVAIVVSLLGAILMVPICVTGKERNYIASAADETFTLRKMFSYLIHNKYLLLYYGGYIAANSLLTTGSLSLITSYYLFGNSMFNLFVGALSVAPSFIVSLVAPSILRKIDKFKLYVICNFLNIILGFAIFFAGYEHVVLFIIFNVIRSIPSSIVGILNFMFTPDCAEYGKFKTGTDAKGITFAIQTFSAKITSAISGSIGMLILGFFGWKEVKAESFEQLAASHITQTPEAIRGLWITYALIPVLGYILAMVLYAFYKLNDKDVQIMAKCNGGEISREEAEKQLSRKY